MVIENPTDGPITEIAQNLDLSQKIEFQKDWGVKYRHLLGIRALTKIKDGYFTNNDINEAYKSYDPLAIAIIIIDFIIQYTEPYSGITEDELFNLILNYFQKIDQYQNRNILKKNEYRVIFDRILDALTYKSHPKIYEEEYTDYSNNPPIIRKYKTRALDYKNFGHGSVLHATKTTVNIFLNLLEVNIEDQQMANDLILKRQIRRGDFTNAIQTAKKNLVLTNQYSLRLEKIIQKTRRDFNNADWQEEIPKKLKRYFSHLGEVISDIRKIRGELDTFYQASTSITSLPQIQELITIIKDTLNRLLPLQNKISVTRDTFLDEQWIHLLSIKKKNIIQLQENLLPAVASLPQNQAKDFLEQNIGYFSQLNEPHIMNLKEIVFKLIKKINISPDKTVSPLIEEATEDKEETMKKFLVFSENIKNEAQIGLEKVLQNEGSIDFASLLKKQTKYNLNSEHLEYISCFLINQFVKKENNKNFDNRFNFKKSKIKYYVNFYQPDQEIAHLNQIYYGRNFYISKKKTEN